MSLFFYPSKNTEPQHSVPLCVCVIIRFLIRWVTQMLLIKMLNGKNTKKESRKIVWVPGHKKEYVRNKLYWKTSTYIIVTCKYTVAAKEILDFFLYYHPIKKNSKAFTWRATLFLTRLRQPWIFPKFTLGHWNK